VTQLLEPNPHNKRYLHSAEVMAIHLPAKNKSRALPSVTLTMSPSAARLSLENQSLAEVPE